MGLKSFNPLTMVSNWMDKATAQPGDTSQAVAPAQNNQTTVLPETETVKDAEVVSGQFIPDQTIVVPSGKAEIYTEQLRKTIASFNEDRVTPMKWIVIKFFEVLSYFAPLLVAFVVGLAIGNAWAGPFDIHNLWGVYSYVISVVLELMVPCLGYACTVVLKQAFMDRSKVALLVILSVLFLALAVGNSFAQMYLIEGHIKLAADDTAGHISLVFRSFTPMTVDIIATIFLGVVTVKNLQKFLADKTKEAQAIRAGAEAEIAVDEAFQAAERRRREAEAEQRRKDEQLDTMQEFYRIQNQKLLQDARSKLLDEGDNGRKGRYGGAW
jgi:hypothetical protein